MTIPPARPDGRPQYYDIEVFHPVQCFHCLLAGDHSKYGRGEAVFNDPANSPAEPGGCYTICVKHLPDDAVIYDPHLNTCRNVKGDHTWTE